METVKTPEEVTLPIEGLTDAKTMAAYLKISASMVTKLRNAGAIKPPVKIGASSRWCVDYVRELGVTGVSLPKQSEAA